MNSRDGILCNGMIRMTGRRFSLINLMGFVCIAAIVFAIWRIHTIAGVVLTLMVIVLVPWLSALTSSPGSKRFQQATLVFALFVWISFLLTLSGGRAIQLAEFMWKLFSDERTKSSPFPILVTVCHVIIPVCCGLVATAVFLGARNLLREDWEGDRPGGTK